MSRGICTPEQQAECPLMQHFTDEHHLYYPKKFYRSPTEKVFRNLPENKEQLCRMEHMERHATEDRPQKPTHQEMIDAISATLVSREIAC